MSLPSLNKRVERARILLTELQQNLETLPPACRDKVARNLEHFAGSLEACLQTAAMQTGPEPRLDRAEEAASLESDGTSAWLEDSLGEVHIGDWRWNLAAEHAMRQNAARDSYRIALADAMRRLTDPEQIKATAAHVLGKHLGASRVFYVSVAPGGQEVILEPGYADGVSVLTGRFRLADFSRNLFVDHPDGCPYMITDIPNDPKLTEEQRTAYMALNVQSHIDVPLLIDGQFAALLSIHQSTPRQWSEDEVALVVETAERTWASVERAHAEAALRESEARFHASIESLQESFVLYSAVRTTRTDGKPGRVADLKFEYVNAGACRINGKLREELLGHTLLEVLPGSLGRELFKRYLRVIRSSEPLMERVLLGDTPASARVFNIHAVKMGDGLVVTQADVTEQVRLETDRQQAITQVEIHQRLTEQSEKDRQGYARELHDGPIQSLASIAYNIQYIKDVFPDPLLCLELEQIGSAVRGAVQELRQVINELRPPSALRFGLTRAIRLHAQAVEDGASSIQWQYTLEDDNNRFPAPVCMALFRIYQEAVNNVIRHSEATRAWIHLRVRSNKIVLDIRDNGKGLPLRQDFDTLILNNHFGLAGMNERAGLIGGKLVITSKTGGGTRIKAVVPFPTEAGIKPSSPSAFG